MAVGTAPYGQGARRCERADLLPRATRPLLVAQIITKQPKLDRRRRVLRVILHHGRLEVLPHKARCRRSDMNRAGCIRVYTGLGLWMTKGLSSTKLIKEGQEPGIDTSNRKIGDPESPRPELFTAVVVDRPWLNTEIRATPSAATKVVPSQSALQHLPIAIVVKLDNTALEILRERARFLYMNLRSGVPPPLEPPRAVKQPLKVGRQHFGPHGHVQARHVVTKDRVPRLGVKAVIRNRDCAEA